MKTSSYTAITDWQDVEYLAIDVSSKKVLENSHLDLTCVPLGFSHYSLVLKICWMLKCVVSLAGHCRNWDGRYIKQCNSAHGAEKEWTV